MQNAKLALDAWRDAEHRRDGLAVSCPEWQEAEVDVTSAAKAYHAEIAQASARYAEADFERPALFRGWIAAPVFGRRMIASPDDHDITVPARTGR